jgi:hypothetical protein
MTDNSWPNSNLPGLPLNPEKDGWHWVGGEPIFWQSDGEHWLVYDCYFQWKECGHKEYGGPCPSPAELQNLKALAIEAAEDIEAHIGAEYGTPTHPALKRRYERDMDIVYRLREAAGWSKESEQ